MTADILPLPPNYTLKRAWLKRWLIVELLQKIKRVIRSIIE
jgi:hypothetical protein